MKKTLAIFFLSVYLFSTTEFSQFLKLPVLWQHFQEHAQHNKNISFFSFLKMHYFNGDPRDADYEKDMQLPFKSHSLCELITIAIVLPSTYSQTILPVYNNFKVNIPPDENLLSADFLSAIWQPPRA